MLLALLLLLLPVCLATSLLGLAGVVTPRRKLQSGSHAVLVEQGSPTLLNISAPPGLEGSQQWELTVQAVGQLEITVATRQTNFVNHHF